MLNIFCAKIVVFCIFAAFNKRSKFGQLLLFRPNQPCFAVYYNFQNMNRTLMELSFLIGTTVDDKFPSFSFSLCFWTLEEGGWGGGEAGCEEMKS